jgi:flavin-dependent dehydrogenase
VVVDASGRGTVIGNQLGLKQRVPGLNKTSLWSYYEGGKRGSGRDAGETTVFMIPDRGWFWYIPLPDNVVSVGVVASPEYLFDDTERYEQVFEREVQRCEPLMQRLSQATRSGVVRGIRQLAYRNRRIVGDGWLMIGDAAAFLDPIYSSGLFLALSSAELAADCVIDGLKHEDVSADRLGRFAGPLMQGVDVIRRLIHAFYDPKFSFKSFVDRYPDQKAQLIDCLVGDVLNKDMTDFKCKLEAMTPAPPPLESCPA